MWGLDLLEDPERLAEYVASFDREAYGEETGEAVRKAQSAIDRATSARASIVSLIAAGHLGEAEAAEQLAELATERAEGARRAALGRWGKARPRW